MIRVLVAVALVVLAATAVAAAAVADAVERAVVSAAAGAHSTAAEAADLQEHQGQPCRQTGRQSADAYARGWRRQAAPGCSELHTLGRAEA